MKLKNKIIMITILLSLSIFLLKTDRPIGEEKRNIEQTFIEKPLEDNILTPEYPEFWIKKIHNKDLLLMDDKEIDEFNKRNFLEEDSLVDLEIQEPTINKGDLITLINNLSKIPRERRYDSSGDIMDKDFYSRLISNLNMDSMDEIITLQYGVAVHRTMIRTFPTLESSYREKGDVQFDRFMETAIYPWEPLIIYSESKDGEWYLGRIYNYLGWIPKKDIALGEKEEIFRYLNENDFLMVIGGQVLIDNILYDMGVKIPLVKENKDTYIVSVPTSGENGSLKVLEREIEKSEDFNKGYLPYTKENIISQAFKFYGEEYGWGGMNNKRDCSAFIMDIHRTFGIKLPRNTLEQGVNSIGKTYDFTNIKTLDERLKFLNGLPEAIVLYMSGHTMLYLGEHEGNHYIIHQFAGYYEENNGKLDYVNVMKTHVTPVTIKLSTGKTYIEGIYSGKEFVR